MADIAINRSKKIGIKNIYYKLGSSRNIPFKTKFDIITTTLSFHHWKKKEESINYLLKRLNKNGILMICEFSYEKLTKIQKLVMGKHSLSKVEAKSYQFKGYTKKINIYKNIIIISFKKELKSINNKH
jgi:2-polyprenyl-3-methyl-5-hydroxy-6-metoxy-1,4-benzoquinol methylase